MQNLCQFYEELLSSSSSNEITSHYLKDAGPPKLTKEQSEQCEGEITENEVQDALGTMSCNNGLANESDEAFWSELKTSLLLSYKKIFLSGELSIY